MVQSWYGGWNRWVYIESTWESQVVLLYEWLQNYFETKEPIGREWCKILQKARTANPSATTKLAVAQWQMSYLWKDLNTRKQHVENISQMYDKNSWGLCLRSNQKKTRSAHPFEGARYWLGCSRSTLPCHLSERLHSRSTLPCHLSERLHSRSTLPCHLSERLHSRSTLPCHLSERLHSRSTLPCHLSERLHSRSTLPCHLSERLHSRSWQTPGNHQRH